MERKELKWFEDRIGTKVLVLGRPPSNYANVHVIKDGAHAADCYNSQDIYEFQQPEEKPKE